jgi:hypothetical protein
VLELGESLTAVVGCYARPAALDALVVDAVISIRIAHDELLLLAARDEREATTAAAEIALGPLDGRGLVVDVSDGYAAWTVTGEGRFEAFARLCAVPLPHAPAHVQTLFAHVPAKVVVRPDELLALVPSVLSHHVKRRILESCQDLDPTELPAVPLAAVRVPEMTT